MLIKPEQFDNGGEVDFTANYREGVKHGRASLRRRRDGVYEVYVHWAFPVKENEVIHRGSLRDCIDFANARFGLDDRVE